MQFNTRDGPPSTWDRYAVDGNHDGTKDIYDPADAIPSAANYLRTFRGADGNLSQAILGYNHSQAYVNDVLARARRYAAKLPTNSAISDAAVGVRRRRSRRPSRPRQPPSWRAAHRPRVVPALLAWAMAGGRAPQLVDARLHGNVVWILRRYHLRVTAARESGHQTHGDGTAVDLVPADGTTQPVWDASAGHLAQDLGWTLRCAFRHPTSPARSRPRSSSSATTATPATAHRTCTGTCPAHLHISRASGCYGSSTLSPPCEWVSAFPQPPDGGAAASAAQQ